MQFEKAYKGWRQRMETELDRTIDLTNKTFLKFRCVVLLLK